MSAIAPIVVEVRGAEGGAEFAILGLLDALLGEIWMKRNAELGRARRKTRSRDDETVLEVFTAKTPRTPS